MQKTFLRTLSETASTDVKKKTYKHLKGMVAFATLNLAKYAMNQKDPEHKMSEALLKELPKNLAYLDELFQSGTEKL